MATNEQFFENVYDVVAAYQTGFVGAYSNTEAAAALRSQIKDAGGIPDGAMACSAYKLEETGAGKLSLPFLEILKLYPDCLPGGAQGRGDCVSWSTRNACLGTMCCEITSGVPDPNSNKLEGAPEVSDAARLSGVLSTEAIYNWRRHSGDGWSCAEAAQVVLNDSGLWLRKKYDEIDVDFTQYSSKNAGIYGGNTPPASWREIGKTHLVQTVTEVEEYEALRDLLANGYCVSSCGGEGFSSNRDLNGVSNRQGGWSHALAYLAVDDREEIKKLYNGPLVLVQNSWGSWNDGSRRIFGTAVDIPVGSFWARWADIKNRYMIAMSGVNGWPPKKLKNYGAQGNI
ncbi:hypothetical protein [Sphingorhabdus sp.]|uniref:hypothetical protein n=1 Tax=Sphingorhabdus sp. TaxID=1902408 RepID=UPI003340C026